MAKTGGQRGGTIDDNEGADGVPPRNHTPAGNEGAHGSTQDVLGDFAEDLGKFPDINLSETLQRVPGITLNRTNTGAGATINLRGFGASRTSIPGMFPIPPSAVPKFDSASTRNVAEATTVSPTG